jgi:hypothetical protein
MQIMVLILGGLVVAFCLFGFVRGFFQPRSRDGADMNAAEGTAAPGMPDSRSYPDNPDHHF